MSNFQKALFQAIAMQLPAVCVRPNSAAIGAVTCRPLRQSFPSELRWTQLRDQKNIKIYISIITICDRISDFGSIRNENLVWFDRKEATVQTEIKFYQPDGIFPSLHWVWVFEDRNFKIEVVSKRS